LLAQRSDIDAALLGQDDQSALGRITHDVAVA